MTEPLRVLFLPASGPSVGGGHVLRCFALSAALMKLGALPYFMTGEEGLRLLERFSTGVGFGWLEPADDLPRLLDAVPFQIVVVDDYAADAVTQARLVSPSRLLVAIDDLADRPHLADLLIDPSFGRAPGDYAPLLPPGAKVLTGPRYALLRPEFTAPQPMGVPPQVRRVFVSFGLADPGGITARAVAALLPALPGVHFDVALGSGAQSLPALLRTAETEERLHLHVESDAVAALMESCDMAVGAGGSSTWERAVLGLPSISVIVADNQRALAHALAHAEAQLTLEADAADFDVALPKTAAALAAHVDQRRRLAQASHALCDGQGATRTAEAILDLHRLPRTA